MSINNVSNRLPNVYPYTNKVGKNNDKEGCFTENLQNTGKSDTKVKTYIAGQVSAAEIYQMLKEAGKDKLKAEENEGDKTQVSQEETDVDSKESESNIIVNPDGSRVLLVTISIGGMKTTMSLEISKPTAMQNENSIEDTDNSNMAASGTNIASDEIAGVGGEV